MGVWERAWVCVCTRYEKKERPNAEKQKPHQINVFVLTSKKVNAKKFDYIKVICTETTEVCHTNSKGRWREGGGTVGVVRVVQNLRQLHVLSELKPLAEPQNAGIKLWKPGGDVHFVSRTSTTAGRLVH